MKKLLFSLCALLMTFSLSAKKVYLQPGTGTDWDPNSYKYAVWQWGGSPADVWSDFMTKVDDQDYYEVEIYDSTTDLIFVSFQSSTSTPDWGSKKVQTGDLKYQANKKFVITSGNLGDWMDLESTEIPEVEDTYVVAGESALLGTEWSGGDLNNKMTVTDGVATLVLQGKYLDAGSYEYKIVKNASEWIPDGDNLKLTIDAADVYDVTFTHNIGTTTASAVAVKSNGEVVTPSVTYYLCGTMNDWILQKEGYMFVDNALTISLEAGTYEFKINDGTWTGVELNYNDVDTDCATIELTAAGDDESKPNISFTLADAQNVTFEITDAKKVCVKAENNTPESVDIINAIDLNTPMYNTLGQRVGADYKGVVIQNGQKYIK